MHSLLCVVCVCPRRVDNGPTVDNMVNRAGPQVSGRQTERGSSVRAMLTLGFGCLEPISFFFLCFQKRKKNQMGWSERIELSLRIRKGAALSCHTQVKSGVWGLPHG